MFLDGTSQKQLDLHTLSLTFSHRNHSVCFIHRAFNETKNIITCMNENFITLWSRSGLPMFPLECKLCFYFTL